MVAINTDAKLLNEIYTQSINGCRMMLKVCEKIGEEDFFNAVFSQMTEYRKVANDALERIKAQDVRLEKNPNESASVKLIEYIVSLRGLEYVKGIMIRGCNEGIRELVENINICTDAKNDTRKLAYTLIELEEKNIRLMRTKSL